jgi:hypothetical protein
MLVFTGFRNPVIDDKWRRLKLLPWKLVSEDVARWEKVERGTDLEKGYLSFEEIVSE